MSTHKSHAHKQARAARLCANISALAVILLASMLLFLLTTSPALASSMRPDAQQVNPPPENLARVGVSVVRIVSFYKSTTNLSTQNDIACTGLGVIIKSGAATNATDQNNWVLTDGSLVNRTQATCAPHTPNALLDSISIILSNAFNPHPMAFSTTVGETSLTVICQNTNACNTGLALFPFHTDGNQILPYADLATSSTPPANAIGLTQSSSPTALPPATATGNQTASYQQTVTPYSTPVIATNTASEAGAPFVNALGEITGMHLTTQTAPSSVTTIQSFLNGQNALKNFFANHPNLVHDNWNNGITFLYQNPPNTQVAMNDFQQAFAENPQFVGAQTFAQLTKSPTNGEPGKNATPTPSTSNSFLPTNIMLFNFALPTIPLLASAFIVLLALIFLMTRLFSKSAHRREFDADLAAARQIVKDQHNSGPLQNQLAPQTNNRPATIQTSMPTPPMPLSMSEQEAPTLPIHHSGVLTNPQQELHCPNCGHNVTSGISACPNCHIMLSPSDSGLHLRPSQPVQQLSPSMPPLAPRPPLIENQPTLEFPFDTTAMTYNGNNNMYQNYGIDAERTMPNLPRSLEEATTQPITYSGKRPVVSPIIGFEVAPRTNRGIKRKHKANEDSVFAAQGTCPINGKQCQVGLFIVADGMGGHANGQDASRLAIKTIRETVLPQLLVGMEMNKETLRQVLVEGVKQANQAINERNMEQHADMGTTMTGTLIVGMPTTEVGEDGQTISYPAIACVINVGDSRTYRYRVSDGLKKLTQDHSVVASLVAAGIIQEDDIYTHPRRNQIYRSLGEKLDIEVDAFIVPLNLGDRLLVCSDGLWDMVRDPKLEETIRLNLNNIDKMSEALIQAALDGGGEDNVSVIVAHMPEDAIRLSPHPLQEMEIVGRDAS